MRKRILFIGTGGTIASELSKEGLQPGVGAAALLGHVPDVAELCEVESRQLCDLDSTNIGPEQWLGMGEEEFARRFAGTPLMRSGPELLRRNVLRNLSED